MKERYQHDWALRIKADDKMSKLRTYKLNMTKTFGIEKYLELNERKHSQALCALRISSHKPNIEQGRYLEIKSKVEDCAIFVI